MIARIWHGWTTPENAEAYETLLRSTIIPGIVARQVQGFLGMELLRQPSDSETEFITLMWFESMEAVTAFAGPDPEKAVVPPAAQAVLSRFDARSRHYEVREHREAGTGHRSDPRRIAP